MLAQVGKSELLESAAAGAGQLRGLGVGEVSAASCYSAFEPGGIVAGLEQLGIVVAFEVDGIEVG